MQNPTEITDGTKRSLLWGSLIGTAIAELITIACRIFVGHSAAEFNATNPPFLLQIHHMFWGVPFLLIAIVGHFAKWNVKWAWIIVNSLLFSDLMHHFVVLPLWAGNTGWHWP